MIDSYQCANCMYHTFLLPIHPYTGAQLSAALFRGIGVVNYYVAYFMMIDYNGDTEYAIINTVLLRIICKLGLALCRLSKIKLFCGVKS